MSDNRTTELLPCPFCGSRAHLYGDDYWFYWVECICCYCKVGYEVGYEETTEQGFECVNSGRFKTAAEAIAAWNTRAERTTTMLKSFIEPSRLDFIQEYLCSKCGEYAYMQIVRDGDLLNYCPNCGARVEKVDA